MTGESGPAWASWLGIVAVVLGVLLTAEHGTEWLRQAVLASAAPADGHLPAPVCPRDELIEEGLSAAECAQLVDNVRSFIVSAPPWFPGFQRTLAAAGTGLALLSILLGAALVDRRGWAPAAALPAFAALAAVDLAGFLGALEAGPILRAAYLWNHLLWFSIHFMMALAVVAGRRGAADGPGGRTWDEPHGHGAGTETR